MNRPDMDGHARQRFQEIVTKLDLGHTTVKEAKAYAKTLWGVVLDVRSKEDFIRKLHRYLVAAHPAP